MRPGAFMTRTWRICGRGMNACGQRRGMCSPNFPSCNKLKKIRRNFRRISASLWLASTYGKMIVEKDAKEE